MFRQVDSVPWRLGQGLGGITPTGHNLCWREREQSNNTNNPSPRSYVPVFPFIPHSRCGLERLGRKKEHDGNKSVMRILLLACRSWQFLLILLCFFFNSIKFWRMPVYLFCTQSPHSEWKTPPWLLWDRGSIDLLNELISKKLKN